MAERLAVIKMTRPDELYCCYGSQTEQQPCYAELDLERGTLTADYDAEVGGAVPLDVWHGRTLRFPMPCLLGDDANGLLDVIAPLAQIILDGAEIVWDGNNHVGRMTDAAVDASDKITKICEDAEQDYLTLTGWYAEDWLGEVDADDLGITADTTDDELTAIEQKLDAEALDPALTGVDNHIIILDLPHYLRELRDGQATG